MSLVRPFISWEWKQKTAENTWHIWQLRNTIFQTCAYTWKGQGSRRTKWKKKKEGSVCVAKKSLEAQHKKKKRETKKHLLHWKCKSKRGGGKEGNFDVLWPFFFFFASLTSTFAARLCIQLLRNPKKRRERRKRKKASNGSFFFFCGLFWRAWMTQSDSYKRRTGAKWVAPLHSMSLWSSLFAHHDTPMVSVSVTISAQWNRGKGKGEANWETENNNKTRKSEASQ